jgi:tRNA dimethylallyltransferase
MGPTACGKSALALALAERIDAEIVSVDSAQIYRGMDIGTAKPSASEQARVPHHLIDVVDPDETYSAARFADDARRAVAAIHARGRRALVVGGTMLYFKALRVGFDALPGAAPGIRARLDAEAAAHGWPALHRRLAAADPLTAARLKPNDAQRIQRALEVIELAGMPMSRLLSGGTASGFQARWIALVPPDRAALHERIAIRFEAMLSAGLVAELRGLRARYALCAAMPSMRSVGYRQAWEFLDGTLGESALRERGIAATRQLAKRQLTWLRTLPADVTLDPLERGALERLRAAAQPA